MITTPSVEAVTQSPSISTPEPANWKDVQFDLVSLLDRQDFKSDNPGRDLPVTHENNAVLHGQLCRRFRDGDLSEGDFPFSALLRIAIECTGGISFALLDEFARLSEVLVSQLQAETVQPTVPQHKAKPTPNKPGKPIPHRATGNPRGRPRKS